MSRFTCYANIVFILMLLGCKKDDVVLIDCGCNNEIIRTVPSSNYYIPFEVQTEGRLLFKHPEIKNHYLDDPLLDDKFWIVQVAEGCYNCRQHYIVCNEELLNSEFSYLRESGVYDSLNVRFYGKVRRLYCNELEPRTAPGDYAYSRIDLDSIKLIE